MRTSMTLVLTMLSAAVAADTVKPVEEVDSYVRIRSAPDASSDAVSRLHKSKPRPHVRTLDGWYEVELDDGSTGFVSSDWSVLVVDDEAGEDSIDAAPADEPEKTTSKSLPAAAPEPASDANTHSSVVQESSEASAIEAVNEAEDIPAPAAETSAAKVPDESSQLSAKDPAKDAPQHEQDVGEVTVASTGPRGPAGPPGPAGPAGPPGDGAVKGTENFLVKFKKPTVGGNSQIYDDGNRVGIGTVEPEQKLEVNGSIQINDRTTTVAGVMMTQIGGETGYILHNQASTMTIGAGSVDRITINKDGNVGVGVSRPEHPLELASGAYVSAGGVWTNSSSRVRKENIESLTLEEALAALAELKPVEFNYLGETQEKYLGFIAEDVPELVATKDRQSLSPMDIVAVLTRVVQEQQETIESLEQRILEQERSRGAGQIHAD